MRDNMPRVKIGAALVAGGVLAAAAWWRRHPSACPYAQRFWTGKIGRRPGLELQLGARGIRLSPCALDHAWVGVDPAHPRGWMTLAGADRQRARPAAQVKHSFPDANRGDVQQVLLEPTSRAVERTSGS
jgi:hypothetical protein